MDFVHIPVMLNECLDGLNLKEDGIYVDATIGGAGHSLEILKRTKSAKLIGIDQDKDAIAVCRDRLKAYKDRVTLVLDNFSNLNKILEKLKIEKIDGILIDLGVSSYQLDNGSRGFSFRFNSPLDMRMNQDQKLDAKFVVNNYGEGELKRIIFDYGEERFAPRVAHKIVESRSKKPIETTFELRDLIMSCVPNVRGRAMDSVQRVFQAIRICVNGELDVIGKTINQAVNHLNKGGRIVVLTFHSLEDRIVKTMFKELSTNCTCPPEFPVCVCGGNNAKLKLINNKPIIASTDELKVNSRSSSAKLRIAEKIK